MWCSSHDYLSIFVSVWFGLFCFVWLCFVFFPANSLWTKSFDFGKHNSKFTPFSWHLFFFFFPKKTNKQTNKPAETLFKHKNTPGARHSNILNLKLTSNSVFSNSGGSAHSSDDDDEESGSASPRARYRNNNDDND